MPLCHFRLEPFTALPRYRHRTAQSVSHWPVNLHSNRLLHAPQILETIQINSTGNGVAPCDQSSLTWTLAQPRGLETKRRRFAENQIIGILKEYESGVSVAELCLKNDEACAFSQEPSPRFGPRGPSEAFVADCQLDQNQRNATGSAQHKVLPEVCERSIRVQGHLSVGPDLGAECSITLF